MIALTKYYGDTKYYYVIINDTEVLSTSYRGLIETVTAFREIYHV